MAPGRDLRPHQRRLRYSHGLLTSDQPVEAVRQGLISRDGALAPSNGSRSERFSLSAGLARPLGRPAHRQRLSHPEPQTLWTDFTHDLKDPVNGDQEQQAEPRTTSGCALAYRLSLAIGPFRTDTRVGVQGRFDDAYVDRRHTRAWVELAACNIAQADGSVADDAAVDGPCNADRVHLDDLDPYLEDHHPLAGLAEVGAGAPKVSRSYSWLSREGRPLQ